MKTLKAHLLAATVVAGGFAGTAQAQFVYPAADIKGAGASSIQNVLVESLNCIGNPGSHAANNTDNLNPLGTNNGSTSAVAEGKFVQTRPTKASPDFDCDREEIQPNLQGHYIATGSGTGRTWWRTFTSPLDGTSGRINPFPNVKDYKNLDYAFSDAPATASDLTAYDQGANNNANRAGAPIQFPLYVLPVAIAYNPTYGVQRTKSGTRQLTFAVNPKFVTKDADGNATGGLRLSQDLYCKIFNGSVANFNNTAFKSTGTNGSLKDPNDTAQRWKKTGVPIRLVGRLDNSGTTDIFTRHLAAACSDNVSNNKFAKNSEALPFDKNSSIDLRSFRSDTRYFPNTTGDLAGTSQSLSGAVFVRASGGNPARIDTSQGQEKAGLFMVADGSSGVRDAINFQPAPGSQNGAVALNGKLGYIGADFVKPSAGAQLFAAALQVGGAGSAYASPTATAALTAFGNFLPPETTAATGTYNANDSRTGPTRDGTPGNVKIDRANPLHWLSVLYSNANNTLANPSVGYPITGTTQYLGYTCYADRATRLAVSLFLDANLGNVTKNSANKPVAPGLFNSSAANAPGLLAQLNIAPLPNAWRVAVAESFLRQSSNAALARKRLWISSALPTKNEDQSKANPGCANGKGA